MIAHCCKVKSNGNQWYEVVEGKDTYVVHICRKKWMCRTWDLTGILCPHAIKAYIHEKQEPEDHVNWWYSKEDYMLVYMHKIQPVRGSKFWKVDPAQSMEPPEIQKMVGRPKVTRKRENAESRKREGLNKSKEPVQDVLMLAPGDCQESGVFMPTSGCVASSSQHTKHSTQYACLSTGSSNPKTNAKKFVGASRSKNKSVGLELHVAPSSATVTDIDGDESEENEQPTIQPKRIFEAKTRLEAKKIPHRPTGTMKIGFKGDENGASIPKNLLYSPKMLSYKGNVAIPSNQLNVEKEKK
ncbi:hypothetical protein FXO38_14138 [Capsicum annuum]|nr:hypothetical protein FXO38_14138 [Capsicum annuum]KAF3658666.1 hypothetical protein FXO37_14317 [Capsicum annuum]